MPYQIALDGPSGVGKSTVAKLISKKLGCIHIDTGAMYRAVTLKALALKIDLEDENAYKFLESTSLVYNENGEILLDGKGVDALIRTVEVTENVSLVSSFKYVREKLVKMQQDLSVQKDVVMDGRDIGTKVLPNATLKIFLDAPVEVRAERRFIERNATGKNEKTLLETIDEIRVRDEKDSTRKESPLKKADDALLVDTNNLTATEVADKIIAIFRKGKKMTEKDPVVENSQPEEKTSVEQTAVQLRVNQIVKAKVKRLFDASKPDEIINDRILLETEDGVEGFLHRKNMILSEKDAGVPFVDIYIEGDEFELAVARTFEDGKVLFSQTLVEKIQGLEQFEELVRDKTIIKAKITKVMKTGVVLEYKGYDCILPERLHPQDMNFESKVGEELEVGIIRIDKRRLSLVVSQFPALNQRREEEYADKLKDLEIGAKLKCVVKSFKTFGAFVELENGLNALLHISDISHDRIQKPESVLKLDEELEVVLTEKNGTKLNVSRKALLPNYFKDFVDQNKKDSVVTGKVCEINNSGVVVDFDNGVYGFIPRSEFAWGKNVFLEDHCKLGDKLEAKIIDISVKDKRIVLSKKQMIENPWLSLELKKNDKIKVKVLKKVSKGYKVEYQGLFGFLPEKSLSKEGLIISDGTNLDLYVLAFSKEEYKFIVTMREDKKFHEKRVRKPKEEVFQDSEKVSAVSSFGEFLEEYKGGN